MREKTDFALSDGIYKYRLFLALLVLWLLLLAILHDFPAVDIWVQNLFYTDKACDAGVLLPQRCGLFGMALWPNLTALRSVLYVIPPIFLVVCLIAILLSYQPAATPMVRAMRQPLMLLFSSWFISVVLIVNMFLKAYSGRPRPQQTDFFGGYLPFVPAGIFSGHCDSNCSFISGEAASAGWLLCVIPFLPKSWHPVMGTFLVIISIATPVLRVMMGGHYFSDALLGWLAAPVVFAFLISRFGWKMEPRP
jgi:lipid A 4'-phosphatase